MTGQISLFDLGDEELSRANEISYPPIEEFDKEAILAGEKEVLGVYISGHPLEDYVDLIEKNSNCTSDDFVLETSEDGSGMVKVEDGKNVIIGGMITNKTVKTTRNGGLMAYLTLEDIYGTVEILVFPKTYEKQKALLVEEAKVFVRGRVSLEDDKDGKIICRDIVPFDKVPCELWLRLKNKQEFQTQEERIYKTLSSYDGRDRVIIYLQEEKQMKQLPPGRSTDARRVIKEQAFHGMEQVVAALKERALQT
jgi:DNA polymerase-3 subunit alpha